MKVNVSFTHAHVVPNLHFYCKITSRFLGTEKEQREHSAKLLEKYKFRST